MSSGSRPVDLASLAVRELFVKSGGDRYGLTEAEFHCILEQVAAQYLPGAQAEQRQRFWRELKLEELALARACAAGNELAWQVFLTRYREKLYDIARGITKEDSGVETLLTPFTAIFTALPSATVAGFPGSVPIWEEVPWKAGCGPYWHRHS